MKILKTEPKVTIRGEICTVPYRAVLHELLDPPKWELAIEQQVKGKWIPTSGRWVVDSQVVAGLALGLWIHSSLRWRLEPNLVLLHEVLSELLDKLDRLDVCMVSPSHPG